MKELKVLYLTNMGRIPEQDQTYFLRGVVEEERRVQQGTNGSRDFFEDLSVRRSLSKTYRRDFIVGTPVYVHKEGRTKYLTLMLEEGETFESASGTINPIATRQKAEIA